MIYTENKLEPQAWRIVRAPKETPEGVIYRPVFEVQIDEEWYQFVNQSLIMNMRTAEIKRWPN